MDGATYYLSSTTPGTITQVPPSAIGTYVKSIAQAISSTRLIVKIGDAVQNVVADLDTHLTILASINNVEGVQYTLQAGDTGKVIILNDNFNIPSLPVGTQFKIFNSAITSINLSLGIGVTAKGLSSNIIPGETAVYAVFYAPNKVMIEVG